METDRLIIRPFTTDDLNTFFEIFSNVTVNTYLPMFPLKTLDEARTLLKDKYLDMEYRYAVCLKENTDWLCFNY